MGQARSGGERCLILAGPPNPPVFFRDPGGAQISSELPAALGQGSEARQHLPLWQARETFKVGSVRWAAATSPGSSSLITSLQFTLSSQWLLHPGSCPAHDSWSGRYVHV